MRLIGGKIHSVTLLRLGIGVGVACIGVAAMVFAVGSATPWGDADTYQLVRTSSFWSSVLINGRTGQTWLLACIGTQETNGSCAGTIVWREISRERPNPFAKFVAPAPAAQPGH